MKTKNFFRLGLIQVMLVALLYPLTASESSGDFRFFPEIEGWEKPDTPEIYSPGTLWDLINGAADVYLNYDFEELSYGNYTASDGRYIGLEVYRHATEYDAFGIYSQERPLSGNYIDIGAQGYEGQGIINFVSGQHYVKLSTHSQDEASLKALRNLAKSVSDLIAPQASLPKELSFFPSEGLITNSEQYVNSNFLGMTFLSNAFIAAYENADGKKFNLFVIHNDSPEISEKMLNDYLKYAKMEPAKGQGRYIVNDRFNGPVGVLWKDTYLLGFYELEDKNLQEKYFSWFEQVVHN